MKNKAKNKKKDSKERDSQQGLLVSAAATLQTRKERASDKRYNNKKQENQTKTVTDQKLGNIVKLGAKLGASNLLKQGVSDGTKALSSDIGKILIDEGIKHAPDLHRFGTSKIKNENVRKVLESDVANYIVEETQKKAKEDLSNLFGWL